MCQKMALFVKGSPFLQLIIEIQVWTNLETVGRGLKGLGYLPYYWLEYASLAVFHYLITMLRLLGKSK